MKAILAQTQLVIIIILLLIIVYLRQCTGKCPATVTEVKRDTMWIKHNDTIVKQVPLPVAINGKTITKKVPVPIYFTDTLIKEIPAKLTDAECAAIARRYFNSYSYADTNKHQYGYSVLREEVTQNRITSREWENHWSIPVVTNTKTISRNQLYAGFDIYGTKLNPVNGAGIVLTLKTKNDNMYHIGAALLPGNSYYHAGMDFKIQIKK